MCKLNEALNLCLVKMTGYSDFNDYETTSAIKELLSVIISNPSQIINCICKEKLALVLSRVMTSSFPQTNPIYEGINMRDLLFSCAFYLYMHQLETGYFYDKNWPAFIMLLHLCHSEFAKFSFFMNPFFRNQEILGNRIEYNNHLINIAKGVELNMMLVAKKKGYLTNDLQPWFAELYHSYGNILVQYDPFRKAAIPLYKSIGNYLKENDLTFIQRVI